MDRTQQWEAEADQLVKTILVKLALEDAGARVASTKVEGESLHVDAEVVKPVSADHIELMLKVAER